ncbi:MAG: hypothetical protein WCR53_02720, partial [Bacteroidaceae bacterium]
MRFFQKIFNRSPLLYGVLPLLVGILLADVLGHARMVLAASIITFLISFLFLVVSFRHRHLPSITIWCLLMLFFCLGSGGYALHHLQSNTLWPPTRGLWQAIVIDAADRGKTE